MGIVFVFWSSSKKRVMARNIERKEFPVLEMSCASCANHVEQTVRHLEGVGEASVNFASNTLSVAFDPGTITPVQIRDAVRAAGYDLIVDERNGEQQREESERARYRRLRRDTVGAWAFSLPLMLVSMAFMHMPYGNWIMLALSLPVLGVFGRMFFVGATLTTLQSCPRQRSRRSICMRN